jgi:hypothetical protein
MEEMSSTDWVLDMKVKYNEEGKKYLKEYKPRGTGPKEKPGPAMRRRSRSKISELTIRNNTLFSFFSLFFLNVLFYKINVI